jgi:hypothetical protein
MSITHIQDLTGCAPHASTLVSLLEAVGATVLWHGPFEGHVAALVTYEGRGTLVTAVPGGLRVHPLLLRDAVGIGLDMHEAAGEGSLADLRVALAPPV